MPVVKEALALKDYTYYCFTQPKILVLMVIINEACEESSFHNKMLNFFNFHSFSMISTTCGHKKACKLAIVHPMGLYLVVSCSSRDSTSGSIVFIM